MFRNVQRFRGGLVFKAHRRLYHSTLGLRVIKKKKKTCLIRQIIILGTQFTAQNGGRASSDTAARTERRPTFML